MTGKSENNFKRSMRIGALVSAIWIAIGALSVNAADVSGLTRLELITAAIVFLLPLAFIWIAVLLAGTVGTMRQEANELRTRIDRLQKTMSDGSAGGAGGGSDIRHQLEKIAEMTQANDRRLSAIAEQSLTALSPPREIAALAMEEDALANNINQPALPMSGLENEPQPRISVAEFIKALNFPDNADDKEGFRVMRIALEDRRIGGLVDISKEILTIWAEDGIFMDDLKPDLPSGTQWKSFAAGKRGQAVNKLAGVSDKTVLSLARSRIKNDPGFRDLAHEFLRRFDTLLADFGKTADNSELHQMGDTRTGRAFMILAKVTGALD